jgi:excisionase family DNA binding protein
MLTKSPKPLRTRETHGLMPRVVSDSGQRLISTRTVAERTDIGKSGIYDLLRRGEFVRPVKIGRRTRFLESDVDQWIASRAQQPNVGAPAAHQ